MSSSLYKINGERSWLVLARFTFCSQTHTFQAPCFRVPYTFNLAATAFRHCLIDMLCQNSVVQRCFAYAGHRGNLPAHTSLGQLNCSDLLPTGVTYQLVLASALIATWQTAWTHGLCSHSCFCPSTAARTCNYILPYWFITPYAYKWALVLRFGAPRPIYMHTRCQLYSPYLSNL